MSLDFQITSFIKNANLRRCLEEIVKYYLENEFLGRVIQSEIELSFKKKIIEKFHTILLEYDRRNIN
jgi:hypothetical protein